MSRRLLVVPTLFALVSAPLALASDEAATPRSAAREAIARFAPRVELAQLFARFNDDALSIETEDGVSAPMVATEMLVARLGTDGKPVMVCVDNEESARRFLDAPIARVERSRMQEQ